MINHPLRCCPAGLTPPRTPTAGAPGRETQPARKALAESTGPPPLRMRQLALTEMSTDGLKGALSLACPAKMHADTHSMPQPAHSPLDQHGVVLPAMFLVDCGQYTSRGSHDLSDASAAANLFPELRLLSTLRGPCSPRSCSHQPRLRTPSGQLVCNCTAHPSSLVLIILSDWQAGYMHIPKKMSSSTYRYTNQHLPLLTR